MRNRPATFRSQESFEQWRERMLDETSRFVEWGLAHPELCRKIPTHPAGKGAFSDRVKALFWTIVLRETVGPPDD
jgi:hypothetical protein